MSVVEIYGGRVDRRYLMKKSKDELVTLYLQALDLLERRTQPEATAPAQDLSAAILALKSGAGKRALDIVYDTGFQAAMKAAAALASSANALSAGDRVDAGEQIKEILSNLQRWELDCGDMMEHTTGHWVSYWDIHPIIWAPEGEAVAAILQSQKEGTCAS